MPPAERATITLRAQILGDDDLPITGAELGTAGDVVEAAASDREGYAVLTLDASDQDGVVEAFAEALLRETGFEPEEGRIWLGLRARAPGYTTRYVSEPLAGPSVRELGVLRLFPVDSIGGRVEDEFGEPVPGAVVCAVRPMLSDRNREAMTLWGPDHLNRFAYDETDEKGEFVLDALREGLWRIWAGDNQRAWSHSDPLRIGEGAEPPYLRLVLRDLPPENRIHGIVLRPDGAPFPGASVHGAEVAEEQDFCHYAKSRDDGRFSISVRASAVLNVRASDPRGELGCVTSPAIPSGTEGVVLTLRESSIMSVVVTDAKARPIQEYAVWITPVGELFYTCNRDVRDPDGATRVTTPDRPFLVNVWAEGYSTRRLGPFDPGHRGELACTLEKQMTVHGVLTAAGEPVVKGIVQLIPAREPGTAWYIHGFPARLGGGNLEGTYTDEEGRYSLPIGDPGLYVLFAEAPGWAAIERDPIELDPRREEEIDLELTGGGAIEGFVRTSPGQSPAGLTVKLCRGDMRVHDVRTDERGWYRREGLTPGPWMIRATVEPASKATGAFAGIIDEKEDVEDFVFPRDCAVVEGETTRYDLDLTSDDRGRLRGSVSIDGMRDGSFSVRLTRGEDPWYHEGHVAKAGSLDPSGEFAFDEELEIGEYWLVLTSAGSRLGDAQVVSRVEVKAGENVHEIALSTAALSGRVEEDARARRLCLISRPRPDLCVLVPLTTDAFGAFRIPRAPAGSSVVCEHGEGDDSRDPTTWSPVLELDLGAGESRSVTLD